ncbi:hypothetical protein HED52_17545 [Ochrobactrum ciceri]|uniref:Stress-induced protein n=1 Tax=Brucella ciceri TaxID=391287 RepID=A0ABX1DVA3_9HYPH|nr:hypothetical protein [Brucella ciceri]
MPGRYQNEDRDDYYNEPYRDYEARGGDYRGYDDRYSSDYARGRYSDDNDERYASRREPNRERKVTGTVSGRKANPEAATRQAASIGEKDRRDTHAR